MLTAWHMIFSSATGLHVHVHSLPRASIDRAATAVMSDAAGKPPPRTADTKMGAQKEIAVFYSDEIPEDCTTSCWLSPDGDKHGKYICSRDVDLWEVGESHDDSY